MFYNLIGCLILLTIKTFAAKTNTLGLLDPILLIIIITQNSKVIIVFQTLKRRQLKHTIRFMCLVFVII